LAFLEFSAAVGISVLHATLYRLYPDDCIHANGNYSCLSIGVAFVWILFWFGLVARLLGPKTSTIILSQLSGDEEEGDEGEGSHTPDGTVPGDSPGPDTPRTSVDRDRDEVHLLMR